jgi:hypothetical protein
MTLQVGIVADDGIAAKGRLGGIPFEESDYDKKLKADG